MIQDEWQQNVQKMVKLLVLWRQRGRHDERQCEADEGGDGGAGGDPGLSPPRHLPSWNIAHHKHYRCRNIKYLLVSHQNEESPQ